MRRIHAAVMVLAFAELLMTVASSQDASPNRAASRTQAGQTVFQQHCAVCHSILPGATLVGPSLYGEMKGAAPAKAVAQARSIILNGKGRMPGQKAQLSSTELDNLLAYLKTL